MALSIHPILIFIVIIFMPLIICRLYHLFYHLTSIINSLSSWIIDCSQCFTPLWSTFVCASPTAANLEAKIVKLKRKMGLLAESMMRGNIDMYDKHVSHLDLSQNNHRLFEYARSTVFNMQYLFSFIAN